MRVAKQSETRRARRRRTAPVVLLAMVPSSIPRGRSAVPLGKAAALLAVCHVIVVLAGAAVIAQDSTDMSWVGQFLGGVVVLLIAYSAPTVLLVVFLFWGARRLLHPSTFGAEFTIWCGACVCGTAVYLWTPVEWLIIDALAQALAIVGFGLRLGPVSSITTGSLRRSSP